MVIRVVLARGEIPVSSVDAWLAFSTDRAAYFVLR
jgi:hypothetical protein